MLKHYATVKSGFATFGRRAPKKPSEYFFVVEGQHMSYYSQPGGDCCGTVNFADVQDVQVEDGPSGKIILFFKQGNKSPLTVTAEPGDHQQIDGKAYPDPATYHKEWVAVFKDKCQ